MQINAQAKGTGSPSRDRPMRRDHVQWRVVGAEGHEPYLFQDNRGLGDLTKGENVWRRDPEKTMLHDGRISDAKETIETNKDQIDLSSIPIG